MPKVWVSNGEFIDKWTILEIKLSMLTSEPQKNSVSIETNLLFEDYQNLTSKYPIDDLVSKLRLTNLEIWNLMDLVYGMKVPDEEYAKLSLEITYQNQKRAFIKREIDERTDSETSEEKSYFSDQGQLVEGNHS